MTILTMRHPSVQINFALINASVTSGISCAAGGAMIGSIFAGSMGGIVGAILAAIFGIYTGYQDIARDRN